TAPLELSLERWGSLSVHATDPRGNPLAGAVVRWNSRNADGKAAAGDEGEVRQVVPAGEYRLTVLERVVVEPGGEGRAAVTVDPSRTLRIQTLNEDGVPADVLWVCVRSVRP